MAYCMLKSIAKIKKLNYNLIGWFGIFLKTSISFPTFWHRTKNVPWVALCTDGSYVIHNYDISEIYF